MKVSSIPKSGREGFVVYVNSRHGKVARQHIDGWTDVPIVTRARVRAAAPKARKLETRSPKRETNPIDE